MYITLHEMDSTTQKGNYTTTTLNHTTLSFCNISHICMYTYILIHIYAHTLECPEESRSCIVLLVILGVLTLGISLLIWYIYLKCQSKHKGTYLHTCTYMYVDLLYCMYVHIHMYVAVPFLLYTSKCTCAIMQGVGHIAKYMVSPKLVS